MEQPEGVGNRDVRLRDFVAKKHGLKETEAGITTKLKARFSQYSFVRVLRRWNSKR
jgi:hypothetical protein